MSHFLHLHCHTDRSQFDGLIRIGDLVEYTKNYGGKAAAISDHGTIAASVDLWKQCKASGIKPIIGCEAYISPDKTLKERGYRHIVLIAKNETGLTNLITLCTVASQYFYYRPRIDFSDLKKYGEGIIVSTACIGGIAAHKTWSEGINGLKSLYDQYYPVFGDDFYLEIQPFLNEKQRKFNELAHAFSKEDKRVKLLATGDCHYYKKEDRDFHEYYVAINAKGKDGWKYPYDGPFHVRNMDEMVAQFAELHGYDISYVPGYKESLDRPNEIADKIDTLDLRTGIKIPTYQS